MNSEIKKISEDIADIKRESRITSVIQVTAIILIFFFGITTLNDLKKKIG